MPGHPRPQMIDKPPELLKGKNPLCPIGNNKHFVGVLSPSDWLVGHRRKCLPDKIAIKKHVYNRPGAASLASENSTGNFRTFQKGGCRVEMSFVTKRARRVFLTVRNASPSKSQKVEFPVPCKSAKDFYRRGYMLVVSINEHYIATSRSGTSRFACKMRTLVDLLIDNMKVGISGFERMGYVTRPVRACIVYNNHLKITARLSPQARKTTAQVLLNVICNDNE